MNMSLQMVCQQAEALFLELPEVTDQEDGARVATNVPDLVGIVLEELPRRAKDSYLKFFGDFGTPEDRDLLLAAYMIGRLHENPDIAARQLYNNSVANMFGS